MSNFDSMFENYVAELRSAIADANEWFEKILAKEAAMTGSPDMARENVTNRWPFGATTHPFVLAVYRKYYLAVSEENDRLIVREDVDQPMGESGGWGEDNEDVQKEKGLFSGNVPVAPWIVLIDALHGRHDDLVDALAWLVYQPMGMDDENRIV